MSDTLRRDLRIALRGLRQRAGFAAIAVLTLAIGIGAVTAIFSVVNGVLLRPLPYRDPGALAWVRVHLKGDPSAPLSEAEYWDLRERQRSFERVAGFTDASVNLTGSGAPERLRTGYVTADVLPLLGVAPALGRAFAAGGRSAGTLTRRVAERRTLATPLRRGSGRGGPHPHPRRRADHGHRRDAAGFSAADPFHRRGDGDVVAAPARPGD